MTFQHKPSKSSKRAGSSSSSASVGLKKHVFLPPRSLIILAGPARYEWTHAISSRTSDKVNGVVVDRLRRVSLTFRQVGVVRLSSACCRHACFVMSNCCFQAIKPGSIPSNSLLANELEKDHVFRVYNNIAVHWNHTRGKRKVHWHLVKDFIENLPAGSLLAGHIESLLLVVFECIFMRYAVCADVGSGDGKYFGLNPNVTVIGCDRSLKLLQVSKEAAHETFCCDAVLLPFNR
jgi:alkylated DNA repair protein alkB family protein 8